MIGDEKPDLVNFLEEDIIGPSEKIPTVDYAIEEENQPPSQKALEASRALTRVATSSIILRVAEAASVADRLFPDLKARAKFDTVALASTMLDHDISNLTTAAVGFSQLVISPKAKNPSANVRAQLRAVASFAHYISALAYIATGDKEKLRRVPPRALDKLLHSGIKSEYAERIGTLDTDELVRPITSAEYVAMCQLIKNPPGNSPISVFLKNIDDAFVGTVRDDETGVLNEKGNPMPPERLHEIFEDYSTRQGGLGLQLAKELVHQRDGEIVVYTRPKLNGPTYSHNSRTRESKESKIQLSGRGSSFRITIPKT